MKDDSTRLLKLLQRAKTLLQENTEEKNLEEDLDFLRAVKYVITKYVFLDGLVGRLMHDKQYRKIFFKED